MFVVKDDSGNVSLVPSELSEAQICLKVSILVHPAANDS